nr:LytTR family DNA-binding domain-containing protein [Tepidicella baoligensis]
MRMRILLVDDEPLARARLRALLGECTWPDGGAPDIGEAADAVQAMERLQHADWDVLLLDIHMPGVDGLAFARLLRERPAAPAVVFVTAHAEHALEAFDVEAVDYLTKPVRQERLQQALDKVFRRRPPASSVVQQETAAAACLLIHDRGRTQRVSLEDVVYCKAELKYVTVRTGQRAYIYDGSLHELEQAHPQRWLRIHRNALVARHRVRGLEKGRERTEGSDGWWLRLDGVDEVLAVSRRQLPAVREALAEGTC